MDQKIIVALDAMGGDLAPVETVKGAVDAVKEMNVLVKLVGREEDVNRELAKYTYPKEKIEVVNAEEVISTDEVPTMAIRKKKNSSMVVGMQLVKNGEADAFVSAGSTGALLTGSLLIVGRLPGVERPVLGTCLPTKNGFTFLVDSGANVDCKAKYLEQFGKMGSVYVENVFGKKNPSVALVNIGAEKEKGDSLTKEAYELLEVSDLNFVGNIEPRNIPFGEADVIVCDGFVGNTILKFAEGLSKTLVDIIKSAMPPAALREKQHPAKRSFQAIRIAVNDELGELPPMLRAAADHLNPGGRLAVISFHSLEDRIVKKTMQELATGCTCPPNFPVCVCGKKPKMKLVSRKPITAGDDELSYNPRARSAKLRVAEKL